MRTSAPRLLPLFRSEAQTRMLARLLLNPDETLTARELQEASRMSAASLHRELDRAEAAGIIARDRSRRPHVFQANTDNAAFEHLAALLRATVGAEAEIERTLSALPDIEAAVVHGSWASGAANGRSDIDLLVVGHPDRRQLKNRIRTLSRQLGREIDLIVLTPEELQKLARDRNAFIHAVVDRPHVDLVGDLEEALASP